MNFTRRWLCFRFLLYHNNGYRFCFLNLVNTVAATAMLGPKMLFQCEHFHLIAQFPFVILTFDATKIMKIMAFNSMKPRFSTKTTGSDISTEPAVMVIRN